jgi:hypothetical protein
LISKEMRQGGERLALSQYSGLTLSVAPSGNVHQESQVVKV